MTVEPIRAVGLREFLRDLRKVDREHQNDARRRMRAGAKTVEQEARRRYLRHYRSRSSSRGRRTVNGITAFANNREAGIKLDTRGRPWLAGQEFGSERYRQFRPWTGKAPGGIGSHGRFAYPAVRAEMGDVVEDLVEDLLHILTGAVGPGVNGG